MPLSAHTRRGLLLGFGAAGAAGSGLAAYAGMVEPALRLQVTEYQPHPAAWPAGLSLTIAALADLHAGEPHVSLGRIEEAVAATNALRPDLIVLLGDYAASHRFVTRAVPPAEVARALGALSAPLGVHAILGNHDWWDDADAMARRGGPTFWTRALEAAGIPVLANGATRLRHRGRPVWLLGLDSLWAFGRGPNGRWRGAADLGATLAPALEDEAPAILLAHEPDIFPRVPPRVALTLSGHTHGGQVRLFGYSPVVPSDYGDRYAYGHVAETGRHLIVSGGIGHSILPVRFGVPPEIVLVRLGA